jgi:hypothetical protein
VWRNFAPDASLEIPMHRAIVLTILVLACCAAPASVATVLYCDTPGALRRATLGATDTSIGCPARTHRVAGHAGAFTFPHSPGLRRRCAPPRVPGRLLG